jgi:hypothetical protein
MRVGTPWRAVTVRPCSVTFVALFASSILRAQVVHVATSLCEHVITCLLPVLIVFLSMLTRFGVRLVVTHLHLSLSAIRGSSHGVRAHLHAVSRGYVGRLSPPPTVVSDPSRREPPRLQRVGMVPVGGRPR